MKNDKRFKQFKKAWRELYKLDSYFADNYTEILTECAFPEFKGTIYPVECWQCRQIAFRKEKSEFCSVDCETVYGNRKPSRCLTLMKGAPIMQVAMNKQIGNVLEQESSLFRMLRGKAKEAE